MAVGTVAVHVWRSGNGEYWSPSSGTAGKGPVSLVYPPDDADYHPLAVARTIFLDAFGEREAADALAALESSDAPMRVVQLRALGGAASRVAADATAYAHRERRFMAAVAAFYQGPDDLPAKQAWVDGVVAALHPAPGAYVNFLADEGPARVHDAYPAGTWERLAEVKANLPPGAEIRTGPISTGLGEVYMWALDYESPGEDAPVRDGVAGWQSDSSYLTPEGQRLGSEVERAAYLRIVQDWIVRPQLKLVA